MNKLKPCPLCHSKDISAPQRQPGIYEYYKVKCVCGVETRLCAKREEAIKFWNRSSKTNVKTP